jgi:chromosome segregation ATPase
VDDAKRRITAEQQRASAAEQQLAAAKAQIVTVNNEKQLVVATQTNEYQAQMARISQELAAARQQAATREAELTRQLAAVDDEAKRRITAAQQRASAAEDENKRLAAASQQCEADKRILQGNIDTLNERITNEQQSTNAIREELNTVKTALGEMEKRAAEAERKLETQITIYQKTQPDQSQALIVANNEEIEQLKRQLTATQDLQHTSDERAREAEQRNRELITAAANTQGQIAELQRRTEAADSALTETREQLRQARIEIDRLRNPILQLSLKHRRSRVQTKTLRSPGSLRPWRIYKNRLPPPIPN